MGTVGRSYRVLVWFIRLVVNTFFRRIEVVGREHVPTEGAVIFAGNHPNALMDGFVVATMCGRRPVHFMANAKLWRYPLMSTCPSGGSQSPRASVSATTGTTWRP